jgi:hypothetical protein
MKGAMLQEIAVVRQATMQVGITADHKVWGSGVVEHM